MTARIAPAADMARAARVGGPGPAVMLLVAVASAGTGLALVFLARHGATRAVSTLALLALVALATAAWRSDARTGKVGNRLVAGAAGCAALATVAVFASGAGSVPVLAMALMWALGLGVLWQRGAAGGADVKAIAPLVLLSGVVDPTLAFWWPLLGLFATGLLGASARRAGRGAHAPFFTGLALALPVTLGVGVLLTCLYSTSV